MPYPAFIVQLAMNHSPHLLTMWPTFS